MGNEDAVGQSADEAVALLGERGRHSVLRGWKGRKDEQTAILEGRLKFGLQTHSDDAPSWNPDDRLATSEQNSKALPFHDGVKAADDHVTFVTHLRDGVECLEDDRAWTLWLERASGRKASRFMRPFLMRQSGPRRHKCDINAAWGRYPS